MTIMTKFFMILKILILLSAIISLSCYLLFVGRCAIDLLKKMS